MRGAICGGRETFRRSFASDHNNHNQQQHDPDAPPTRPRPRPPTALRSPLQTRDSNAKMRLPLKGPSRAKTSNKTMPSNDKQPNTTSRPLIPTLPTGAKTANRAPLTPRVAGSVPSAFTTPSARRGVRGGDTPAVSSREDISTPVSAFLNNNITPRSGSRKSRVDSTNSTPTGTPNGTPVLASSNDAFRVGLDAYGPGLGIVGMDKDIPKRPTVTFSQSASEIGNYRSPGPGSGDSKFFFARDAKTVQTARPPMPTKNSSTFFYASGEAVESPAQSSGASAVGSIIGDDRSQSKFFHANGAPELSPSNTVLPPRPNSSLSNASRMSSTRLVNQSPSISFSPPAQTRPASPSKLNQYATVSLAKGSPAPTSTDTARPPPTVRLNSANILVMARRGSVDTGSRVTSHRRSSSSGSSGMKSPTVRNISEGSSIDLPLVSPLTLITNLVPVSTPEEIEDDRARIETELRSPTKNSNTLEHLNELAANARRERKVLDLEITNSSLAAINRTLEREMRKQTAELRRYRRLSRSGRLSIATTASMRTSINSSLTVGEDGTLVSDLSEEEGMSEEETEISDEEYSDEGSLSPGAMAESDLRHRKRDEKRLQLDLSKHQQLLIDSQKMNQSLKRCLGLTEELIGEGKKALDYKVKVDDIQLGGRVLVLDEEVEEEQMDHGGMSEIGVETLRKAREAAAYGTTEAWEGIGKEDRDSGIEIDSTGRGQTALGMP